MIILPDISSDCVDTFQRIFCFRHFATTLSYPAETKAKSSGCAAIASSFPVCPQTAILNVFLLAEPSRIVFFVVPI